MLQDTDPKAFAILFVDDEKEAREVLSDALTSQWRIITAGSVDEALAILERQGDEIAILLSDQRMPGRYGVDLLTLARERWPATIRILTTAYTDFDDAIAAVNRGEILRYIHKPWNIRELRIELTHAMELFLLRREREQLMAEKLSVWQNLLDTGRARDLLVSTAALRGLRNTQSAVCAFLQQNYAGKRTIDWNRLDYWQLMEQETRHSMAIAGKLSALLQTLKLDDVSAWNLADLVATAVSKTGIQLENQASLTTLPALQLPLTVSTKLIELLLQTARMMTLDSNLLRVTATLSANHIIMTVERAAARESATPWNVTESEEDRQHYLLAAFLLSYHVGGKLFVHYPDTQNSLFELHLPITLPEEPTQDDGSIEQIFSMLSD